MADRAPMWQDQITQESLAWAYQRVFEILETHGIRSTMAFVGLFVMPPELVRAQMEELHESAARRTWISHAVQAYDRGRVGGWHMAGGPAEAARWGHEVASHTYTHLPLTDPGVTEADAAFELAKSAALGRELGHEFTTYVFPRNAVPARQVIVDSGMYGYRLPPTTTGSLSRLAAEVNVMAKSSSVRPEGYPVQIPGETFLNWRHGPRLLVPPAVTVRRWSHQLDHAARTGGVAHMWLHPHNLITGRGQDGLFDRCVAAAAKRIRRGDLVNVTQHEYCKILRGSTC